MFDNAILESSSPSLSHRPSLYHSADSHNAVPTAQMQDPTHAGGGADSAQEVRKLNTRVSELEVMIRGRDAIAAGGSADGWRSSSRWRGHTQARRDGRAISHGAAANFLSALRHRSQRPCIAQLLPYQSGGPRWPPRLLAYGSLAVVVIKGPSSHLACIGDRRRVLVAMRLPRYFDRL